MIMDQESEAGDERLRGRTGGASDDREAIVSDIEQPVLEIEKLNLWYGTSQALTDISMKIPEKQITAFIGPSG